jgi:serine phosphatase RsbU (regulator of sigma subunit)
MGVMLFAPLLWSLRDGRAFWTWRRLGEATVVLAALAVVVYLAVESTDPLFFLATPLLVLIAWRHEKYGAAPAGVLLSALLTVAIVHRLGRFSTSDLVARMILLQTFNAVVAFTTLLIAAAIAERATVLGHVRTTSTRLATLQSLTAGLARITSSNEVAGYVLNEAVGLLGGSTGALCLKHGDRLDLAASVGYDRSVIETYGSVPITSDTPGGECVIRRSSIFAESAKELYARYPIFLNGPSSGDSAFAVLLLETSQASVLGTMIVGFAAARSFGSEDRAMLEAVAQEAAAAIERTTANEALLSAQDRLEFLSSASKQLADSLDLDQTLRTVARLAVPTITDRAAVYLVDESGEIERFMLAPPLLDDEQSRYDTWLPLLNDQFGPGAVIRTGEPRYFPEFDAPTLERMAESPEHRELLLATGVGGALELPLTARGQRIGALAFVNRRGRRLNLTERALAEELTSRSAIAIDNARMFSRELGIAETLQLALLPQDLPEIAGMEIAVRYLPGDNGMTVGGDWYDVIPLDDNRFIFVVGDVSGHGLQAASVMASLRFASHGFAKEGHGPSAILDRLGAMLNVRDDEHFATVLCGLVDVSRHEVELASAGHLPPVICADGVSRLLEVRVAPPIGVSRREPTPAQLHTVAPGTTLLAFTDGLVERRGEMITTGLDRLLAQAAVPQASADALLDKVVTELLEASLSDDVALIGVRWLA